MESIRLNKYLSDAGICSRRQADRWIEEKRITVNGEIAGMGMKVAPDSEVCLIIPSIVANSYIIEGQIKRGGMEN